MKTNTMNQIIKRTRLDGRDAKIARVVGKLGIDLNAPADRGLAEQLKELRKSSERNGMARDVVDRLLCQTFSITPETLRALEGDEDDDDDDAGKGDSDDDSDAADVIDDDSDAGDDDDSDDEDDDDSDDEDDDDSDDEDTRRAVAKPSKKAKTKPAPAKSKPAKKAKKRKTKASLPDWISSQMASGTAYQEIRRAAIARGASAHVFVTAWRAARAGRIAMRAERAHGRKVGISA